jgi:hypothetical protein
MEPDELDEQMLELILEVKDLKRAHCEVANANTVQLAFLRVSLQTCGVALWAIALMMAVALWRHW